MTALTRSFFLHVMKKMSVNTILNLGTFVLLITTGFVIFISIQQSRRLHDVYYRVQSTEIALRHIQAIQLAAMENESGARGYAISGQAAFLMALKDSEAKILEELKLLKDKHLADSQLARQLDRFGFYIKSRLAYTDSIINLRYTKGVDAARALVESGVGQGYTYQIQRIGHELMDTSSVMLAGWVRQNDRSARRLNLLLYSVIGLFTLLSLLIISRIRKDITHRLADEKKFRALVDAAPDATVIVDENGIIRMINRQAERMFGYAGEDMLQQPVEMLIPADLRQRHQSHRENFIKTAHVRAMGTGIELFAVRKDGSNIPVEISLSPIQTDEGMLVSAAVRDITLRKNLENELKKSNSELEAFTYSVSHDLRAPLRGIIGFTAILEEDYASQLDEAARRITGVIKSNTLRMGQLIDDLLAFSRMGRKELQKVKVDMDVLVSEVIREMEITGHSVNWHIEHLPQVQADLATIRQVWANLLGNAVKYSAQKPDPQITIGTYSQPGYQVFFVKDNGVGFDNKYKDKLFRVFQRLHTEEEFQGTGVGLALVEKIVTRHGGAVWAEGFITRGATFFFSLPHEHGID